MGHVGSLDPLGSGTSCTSGGSGSSGSSGSCSCSGDVVVVCCSCICGCSCSCTCACSCSCDAIQTSKIDPKPGEFNQHFWLGHVLRATTMCIFSASKRHRIVKKWPNPSSFLNTFHFQMCFAPQWHTLFRHLNFQKRSGPEVLCTF